MTGKCKLCWSTAELKKSHVLSKLAYGRYVANDKNGSCIKLDTLQEDSRQVTRHWFCGDCEKLFGETYTARFLDRVEANRTDCRYEEDLLRFIVSCSLRTCYHQLEHESDFKTRNGLTPAMKAWKAYLLKKAGDVGSFTQHAFVVRDDTVWDERLGMYVSYPHNLVFTQIGPLICFGVLGDTPEIDQWTLKSSMVRPTGGVLGNLVSHSCNWELTDDMRRVIEYADEHCNYRVVEFSKSRNRTPIPWSEYARKRKGR